LFPVIAYSLAHFAVDLGCAYSYFSHCTADSMGFLLYNFCAFALQMPLGLLADRYGRAKAAAAAGCLLTALMCCVRSEGRDAAHQCSKQTTDMAGPKLPQLPVVCLLH